MGSVFNPRALNASLENWTCWSNITLSIFGVAECNRTFLRSLSWSIASANRFNLLSRKAHHRVMEASLWQREGLYVQVAKFCVTTFAMHYSESPLVDSGLKQGSAIPFMVRKVRGNSCFSTLQTEKQIPYGNGVIPHFMTMATSNEVILHIFQGLAQGLWVLIKNNKSELEIV